MQDDDTAAIPEVDEEARQAGLRRRDEARAHRRLLLCSGLFDPGWYLAHAPGADGNDLDPLDHYLFHGVARGAAPGPLFDPEDYLKRAWHLQPGQDDPLGHFLRHGEPDAREARSLPQTAPPSWLPGAPMQPLRLLSSLTRRPALAVMVHAFHVELFAEICEALRFIPYRFTLLVTIASAEHEAVIRDDVARCGLDAVLLVRVAENRGRNFGAMLCCFRDAIRAHALLLHLHTKRSLYRPGGLDGWRRSLLRTLLPASSVVRGLINAFDEDPSLGVVSPAPADEVRPWSFTWLRDRPAATALLQLIGLDPDLPEEMLDYPAGGMFWARTTAIAALLDHPWRAEQFAEEQGQTDGTLAHAIERCIILIAAASGFGFRELDAARGLVRIGWGSRNLDRMPEFDRAGLARELAHAGVCSFDLFDTLLTRCCLSPDALHRFIGVVVERRFPGANNYVSRRRAAEAAVRQAREDGEADLAEIHARFRADAIAGASAGAGPGWSENAIRFVETEEVALDLRLLQPREAVVEALRNAHAAGRRTILVSDSYLTRPLFDAVLQRFDLSRSVDAVYLSAERRARKDRGDLWQLVKADEPDGLFHVGDNARSDIQMTADHGLRHAWLMAPAASFRLHGLLPPGCRGDLGSDILLGPAAAMLFNSPWPASAPGEPIVLDSARQAGALLLGPLLFAFTAWLIRHPATRTLRSLFFVSREGWFLKRIFDAVVRESGRTDLPRSAYLQCSRRAALGALQGGGLQADAVLKGAGFGSTLQDFLRARLGFEADPALDFDQVPIRQPRDNDLLRCVMQQLSEPIQAHGRAMADGLRAHAASIGLDQDQAGFVDVGYSGTMQAALQSVLGTELVGLYMGVSQAASQVRAGGGFAFGAFADGDVSGFTGGYGLMLEAFLTAPHGQVIGHDASGAPLFRRHGHAQAGFALLQQCYDGAEQYALDLLRRWGPDVLQVEFPADAATAMLAALRNGRLQLPPSLSRALAVEDDFCGNGEIDMFGRRLGAGA